MFRQAFMWHTAIILTIDYNPKVKSYVSDTIFVIQLLNLIIVSFHTI